MLQLLRPFDLLLSWSLLISALAAIELYMEVDCNAGCVPFKWPHVTLDIENGPRCEDVERSDGDVMIHSLLALRTS